MIENMRRAFVLSALLVTLVFLLPLSVGYLSTVQAGDDASPPLLANSTIAPNAQINAPAANPIPELTWTTGEPYPVVNGKAVPPPQAVSPNEPPTIGPPTTGGHYYAGSVYSGVAKGAYWMVTEITPPSATPLASQFYYVLQSTWDNKASYDQIGFANANGVWGLTYSWTTGLSPTLCTGTISYHYSANAKVLTAGQQYLFAMTTLETDGKGHGYVWFEAYTMPGQTLVWALHAHTTGWVLNVKNFYCGYYAYTDYEEIYGTTTSPYGAPTFLYFYFTLNKWGTGATGPPWTYATWVTWKSGTAPSFIHTTLYYSDVYIYN